MGKGVPYNLTDPTQLLFQAHLHPSMCAEKCSKRGRLFQIVWFWYLKQYFPRAVTVWHWRIDVFAATLDPHSF